MLLTEVVNVACSLLREFCKHFDKIGEILASLEELADNERLKRMKKGLEEYKKKEYASSLIQKIARMSVPKFKED